MKISLEFTDDDWRKLNLDNSENDWQTAINMLEARTRERYFEPISVLLAHDEKQPAYKRSFGFTILAIDCLLAETFQSFIEGIESSTGKSKKVFVRFLTTRPRFAAHFDEKLAEKFYSEYRSGILHQGEIQGDGLVWSVGSMVMKIGNRVIVNRSAFHQAIRDEFYDFGL
jgi:hypothetical protein